MCVPLLVYADYPTSSLAKRVIVAGMAAIHRRALILEKNYLELRKNGPQFQSDTTPGALADRARNAYWPGPGNSCEDTRKRPWPSVVAAPSLTAPRGSHDLSDSSASLVGRNRTARRAIRRCRSGGFVLPARRGLIPSAEPCRRLRVARCNEMRVPVGPIRADLTEVIGLSGATVLSVSNVENRIP